MCWRSPRVLIVDQSLEPYVLSLFKLVNKYNKQATLLSVGFSSEPWNKKTGTPRKVVRASLGLVWESPGQNGFLWSRQDGRLSCWPHPGCSFLHFSNLVKLIQLSLINFWSSFIVTAPLFISILWSGSRKLLNCVESWVNIGGLKVFRKLLISEKDDLFHFMGILIQCGGVPISGFRDSRHCTSK